MRMRADALAAVLVILAAVACGPRPVLDPRPGMALTAELARADALVREGCYRCLTEALSGTRASPTAPRARFKA